MGFNKNRKKMKLRRDNLGTYLDYSRGRRVDELLSARDECVGEIEVLMRQIAKKLKRSDLKQRDKRGTRPNDIIPR